MKKSIVLLLLAPVLLPVVTYAGFTKTVCNGGPNGYDIVNETHNGNQHNLICVGEGYAKPEWTSGMSEIVLTKNGPINIAKDIEPQIVRQIKNNIIKGDMKLDDKTTLSWHAIKGGYSLTVDN